MIEDRDLGIVDEKYGFVFHAETINPWFVAEKFCILLNWIFK